MSHPLRPLLPNASATPSEPTQQRTKRVASVAACEACRRRKSKCSAERPRCATCIERQTTCEYTTLPTESHVKARKRRFSDLELRCQTYDELLDIIRSRPEHDSIQILKRMRTTDQIQEVLKSIHEGVLLLQLVQKPEYRFRYEFPYIREMPSSLTQWQNPYLTSLLFENLSTLSAKQTILSETLKDIEDESQKMYLVPYHATELVDHRIAHANLSHWTNVSSDNTTLRSLLGIYFVSLFPFHPNFDKEAFLDDLVAGSEQFCSPLLVNAVLAAAWHGYDHVNSRAKHWMPDNFGYRFLAEARRLYDLEKAHPTITTVQAAAIIHLEYYINGIEEVGWAYLRESIDMARRLEIFKFDPTKNREFQLVAATTAWGLFNWQALIAYHTFQPPLLPYPPQFSLPEQELEHMELYVKYPQGQEPINTYNGLVFKAVSDFRVIINDVAKETCKSPGRSTEIPYYEVAFFRSSLTACMHYHILLISLFEPFEKMDPVDGEERPADIIDRSKKCFETLVRLYYLRHGFESYDVTLLQFLPALAFSSLRDLAVVVVDNSSTRHEEIRSTIILCAKGLWDQGYNCFVSHALFHLYVESLDPAEAQLVREVVEYEPTDEMMDLIAREVRSQWPVGIFSSTKENRFPTLDDFVRWWERYGRDRTMRDGTTEESAPN
ncbi:hypothetical protein F5X99DRAFT_426278 [Biscogniauxia marginata]|nr:hypothetical protein F5X99DRAFT_426278 [Biscogniauxia marginata]